MFGTDPDNYFKSTLLAFGTQKDIDSTEKTYAMKEFRQLIYEKAPRDSFLYFYNIRSSELFVIILNETMSSGFGVLIALFFIMLSTSNL